MVWRLELFSLVYLPLQCCSEVACCVFLTLLLTLVTCPRTQASHTGLRAFPKHDVHRLVPVSSHENQNQYLEVLFGAWPLGPGFSSEHLAPALSWMGPALFQGVCPPGSAPGPGCCLNCGHVPVWPADWPGLISCGDSWHCIPYDKVLELDTETTLQRATSLLQHWPAVVLSKPFCASAASVRLDNRARL